jgi:hypothetical protein
MRLPTRTAAATSLAALLIAGLAACGSTNNDSAAAPAGEAAASAAHPGMDMNTDVQGGVASAALRAKGTGNPFADARTAGGHMPMSAQALAVGIAKAAGIKGDATSKAADLRSGLTYLLTEHVYLAGIAVATAYHAGADSDAFKLAAATLDDNSKAIAAAVGSVAPDKEQQFLQSWRSHINDFVTYAVGAKTGGAKGAAMKKSATSNLRAYAKAQGIFFNKLTNGALPRAAVEKEFNTHITMLAKAVDSFAAGRTAAYGDLKMAADHMETSATALATGVGKAAGIPGNPNDAASALRADLTRMLVDHVYLAGVAVFTAYTDPKGLDSNAFKAAAGALDANSVELGKAVGAVAGAKNEAVFLQSWRSHIDDFVSYAKGDATGDQKLKDTALRNLDGYRTAAGAFFDRITNGALPADAVAKDLIGHIETLAGAIDSLKAALIPAH